MPETGKKGKKTREKKEEKEMDTEDEMDQLKEKKEENVKTSGKKNGLPLYFVAILAITALIAGFALSSILAPPKEVSIQEIKKETGKEMLSINAIVVYDDLCKTCPDSHSLLGIIHQNSIEILLAKVPATSKDGRQILTDFNISQLPVLLVPKASVNQEMKINAGGVQATLEEVLASRGTEQLGYYVVEEYSFDGKARTVTLLQTSCPEPDLVTVDLFEDPYSPNTIKYKETVWELRKRFDENVGFNYNFLPTTTDAYPPGPRENAAYLSGVMLCALRTEKFNQFEEEFYKRLCDKNDSNSLDAGELENCTSPGEAILPLSEADVNAAMETAGIQQSFYRICAREILPDLYSGMNAKAELFQANSTPTAVIDCRYKTHPKLIAETICSIKPDLKGCSQK